MEARLAIETVEIGANELAVFHADAGLIDQIGHAAGGIDLIVGTARGACFRLDDLNMVLERLLDDDDARDAGVRRAVCDIKLHISVRHPDFATPVTFRQRASKVSLLDHRVGAGEPCRWAPESHAIACGRTMVEDQAEQEMQVVAVCSAFRRLGSIGSPHLAQVPYVPSDIRFRAASI